MNKRFQIIIPAVLVMLVGVSMAQVETDKLLDSIGKVAEYTYGNTNGVDLGWVEKQVCQASVDKSVRPAVEQKLIDTLVAAKTNDARQFLCRQLYAIGTAKSVPVLESMLTDPEMSHMARYALVGINTPEAAQAMHKALGMTSGKVKAGLINTLVQINYARALADFLRLMNDPDKDVAVAAIRAVGHFPCNSCIAALERRRSSASEEFCVQIDNALLTSADIFLEKGDRKRAGEIYRKFYSGDYSGHLRVAGLRGLVAANGAEAAELLAGAIKGEDAGIRRNAINMMAMIKGRQTTETFVKLARELPADGQELVIRSLAARRDVSAAPAVIDMTADEHENVRLAALEALGDIGTPQAIKCLAEAAASGADREKQIARSSLVRMTGPDIGKALIAATGSGDAANRLEVIRAIGQRYDYAPFETLRKVAKTDSEASVRREAILSMGRIAKPTDLETLVGFAVAPHSPEDRSAAEAAIVIVFGKIADADAQAGPVLAAMKSAPSDASVTLLNLLTRPATPKALDAVRAAIKSTDSAVSDAAIRALGQWPGPAPAEDLYRIASGSTNQIHKVLALRGYIRLAPMSQDPTATYSKALQLAERDDEIRLILGGLHHAGSLRALEIAESYMNDNNLKAEAYMAATKIANVYCWQDRARAKQTLDKVIAEAPNDRIRNDARDVVRKMDEYKGMIATWKGTQAFTLSGVNDGGRVFGTVFAPEEDFEAKDVAWRIIQPEFDGSRRIDLEKTYGGIDYCCTYVRTTVHSPADRQMRMRWSADDYIKGWINGKPTGEGVINLQKGPNTLILKVGDHAGGWSFMCRITNPDDSPVDDLTFER